MNEQEAYDITELINLKDTELFETFFEENDDTCDIEQVDTYKYISLIARNNNLYHAG